MSVNPAASAFALPDQDQQPVPDLDLNLLLVLAALTETRSMAELRRQLRLTPRGAARALASLREALGDELIVQGWREYTLTPMALRLRPRVTAAMQALQDVLDGGTAAPERLGIAMPDHLATWLAAPLAAHLREISDRTAFRPVIGLEDALARLENGALDLVLGNPQDAPPGFFRRALPVLPVTWLCRADHPAIGADAPRLDDLTTIRIAHDGQGSLGQVDDGLEALAPQRSGIVLPDIHTALTVLRETDAVLGLPAGAAAALKHRYGLGSIAVPGSEYRVSLIWHERVHRCQIHAALRNRLAELFAEGARPA